MEGFTRITISGGVNNLASGFLRRFFADLLTTRVVYDYMNANLDGTAFIVEFDSTRTSPVDIASTLQQVLREVNHNIVVRYSPLLRTRVNKNIRSAVSTSGVTNTARNGSKLRRYVEIARSGMFQGTNTVWRAILEGIVLTPREYYREIEESSYIQVLTNPNIDTFDGVATALRDINSHRSIMKVRLLFGRPDAPNIIFLSTDFQRNIYTSEEISNMRRGRNLRSLARSLSWWKIWLNERIDRAALEELLAADNNDSDPGHVIGPDWSPEDLLQNVHLDIRFTPETGSTIPKTFEERNIILTRGASLKDKNIRLNNNMVLKIVDILHYGISETINRKRKLNCLSYCIRKLTNKRFGSESEKDFTFSEANLLVKNAGVRLIHLEGHMSNLKVVEMNSECDERRIKNLQKQLRSPLSYLILYKNHYYAVSGQAKIDIPLSVPQKPIHIEQKILDAFSLDNTRQLHGTLDIETRPLVLDLHKQVESNSKTCLIPMVVCLVILSNSKELLKFTFVTDFDKIKKEAFEYRKKMDVRFRDVIGEAERKVKYTKSGKIRRGYTYKKELQKVLSINLAYFALRSEHNCIYKLFRCLTKLPKVNLLIHAHNGSGFDFPLLLETLRIHFIEKENQIKAVMRKSAILQLLLKLNSTHRIDFRCSYAKIPVSLEKACKSFWWSAVKGQITQNKTTEVEDKFGEKVSTSQLCLMEPHLQPDQYFDVLRKRGLYDSLLEYCMVDCESLFCVIKGATKAFASIYQDVIGFKRDERIALKNIFLNSLTATGIAKKLHRKILNLRQPQLYKAFHLPLRTQQVGYMKTVWDIWRKSVIGGISICNRPGEYGPNAREEKRKSSNSLIVVDYNSQYPDALTTDSDYPLTFGELNTDNSYRISGTYFLIPNVRGGSRKVTDGATWYNKRHIDPETEKVLKHQCQRKDSNDSPCILFPRLHLPHGVFHIAIAQFADNLGFNSIPYKPSKSTSYDWNANIIKDIYICRHDLERVMMTGELVCLTITDKSMLIPAFGSLRKSEVETGWNLFERYSSQELPGFDHYKEIIKKHLGAAIITGNSKIYRPELTKVWSPNSYSPFVASGKHLFGDIYGTIIPKKNQADRDGNEGLRTAIKLVANGLSGSNMKSYQNKRLMLKDCQLSLITSEDLTDVAPVYMASTMLGIVRTKFFDCVDSTVTRHNMIHAETDSIFFEDTEHNRRLISPYLDDVKLGMLKIEVSSVKRAIFIGKKFYFIAYKDGICEYHDNGYGLCSCNIKKAARGIRVKMANEEDFERLMDGESVEFKMETLMRNVSNTNANLAPGVYARPGASRTASVKKLYKDRPHVLTETFGLDMGIPPPRKKPKISLQFPSAEFSTYSAELSEAAIAEAFAVM